MASPLNSKDPEILKKPAYQRKVAITNHARQKLLWTALDRKEAGVKPNSTKPLGSAPRNLQRHSAPPTFGAPINQQRGLRQQDPAPTFDQPRSLETPINDTACVPTNASGYPPKQYSAPFTPTTNRPAYTRPETPPQFINQPQSQFTQPHSAPATPPPPSTLTRPRKLKPAGEITHYLEKINVAIIKLSKPLENGDIIIVEGADCLFLQPVKEMQIDRHPVEKARKGDHIGMKVAYPARVGGKIYLTPEVR